MLYAGGFNLGREQYFLRISTYPFEFCTFLAGNFSGYARSPLFMGL
jgi:hypothetical protein